MDDFPIVLSEEDMKDCERGLLGLTDQSLTPLQRAYAERFGRDEAVAILTAAREHANGINSVNRGSDEFRWALIICIGHECITRDAFRTHHGITSKVEDIKKWVLDVGDLGSHQGDVDYIALMAGAYQEWLKKER